MKQYLTALFNRISKILLHLCFVILLIFKSLLSALWAAPPDKLAEFFDFIRIKAISGVDDIYFDL